MKNKYILIAFAILSILFLLAGCTAVSNSNEDEEINVTRPEKTDYPVIVGSLTFNESPKQVICLSPAITEIICELGFSDRITGISKYCDYPVEISGMPDAGSSANPDIEKILEFKPALLISQSPIAKKDINAIEANGTRVLILKTPASVNELYETYYNMSLIFSGQLLAESNSSSAYKKLSDQILTANGTFESFAFITTADGAVATGDTFAGDFFSYFGENVAQDGTEYVYDIEKLKEKNPQYILIDSKIKLDELPDEYKSIQAIKDGRVIYIDCTFLERPTTRLTELIDQVKDTIRTGGSTAEQNSDEEQNSETENTENTQE